MKMILLKSEKAEGYIDTIVNVLCAMLLIVLALNVFSFLTLKQDMDYIAKELIKTATIDGRTNSLVTARLVKLEEDTGIYPDVSWTASYHSEYDQIVQLGDPIKLTLTYHTNFKGFGMFSIPITLTATHTGLSQKYWK